MDLQAFWGLEKYTCISLYPGEEIKGLIFLIFLKIERSFDYIPYIVLYCTWLQSWICGSYKRK